MTTCTPAHPAPAASALDPDALLATLALVDVYGGWLYHNPRSLAELADLRTAAGFFNVRVRIGEEIYPASTNTWLSLELCGPGAEIQWMEAPSDILDAFVAQMAELGLHEDTVIDRIIDLAYQHPIAQKMIVRVERQQLRIDAARRKLRLT
jgi:hypothetical protein